MKKNYLLGVLGVLLVVGIGISFAYFVSGVLFSGEGSNVTVEPGDMIKVTYDAGSGPLNSEGMMPGDSTSKDFSVTVTPTETEKEATYGIFLDITNNTFVKCDDTNYNDLTNACTRDAQELTYTITDKDSGSTLKTGDLTGVTGKVKLLTETKTVDTETTFNYTITITFVDTRADQNHNQNKTFNGNIEVEFSGPELSAVDTILGLYEDNQGMLAYDEANNLRYIGADPNNYVLFNNELWRIIGVFSEDSHGVSGQKLIKIIRNDSIGNIAWDSANTNDWEAASLQTTLNGDYLNGSGSYASTGIKSDTARNMIEIVAWKLGGTSNYTSASNGLASHFYGYERGTTVYSGRPTTWSGKVALMYPSDYGYATSGGSTTNRDACLAKELYNWDSSSFSDCKNNDWLYDSSTDQWTLTPRSSYSNFVFLVNLAGYVYGANDASVSRGVRPSVYLTSNVKISGGDGTSNSPYTLEV